MTQQVCPRCKESFPSTVMSHLIGSDYKEPLCAICALKIRNQIHGLPKNTPFQGKIAQEMYKKAKEIRKRRNKKCKKCKKDC